MGIILPGGDSAKIIIQQRGKEDIEINVERLNEFQLRLKIKGNLHHDNLTQAEPDFNKILATAIIRTLSR